MALTMFIFASSVALTLRSPFIHPPYQNKIERTWKNTLAFILYTLQSMTNDRSRDEEEKDGL